jgi:hypothetical protein
MSASVNIIGSPSNYVRNTNWDLLIAPWAAVDLVRTGSGQTLNNPLAIAMRLTSAESAKPNLAWFWRFFTAIAASHAVSLKREIL